MITAGSLNGMVGDFLFDERVRAQRAELEKLGESAAPLFDRADTEALYTLISEHGRDITGRLLVLDTAGKVHLDTEHDLTGTLFESEEVDAIVRRGQSVSFGVHESETGRMVNTQSILFTLNPSGAWNSYCSARLVSRDEVIGVLLLISPVTDMMTGLFSLRRQMLLIFLLVALAAVAVGFLFASVLTKPVSDMTKVIQRMSKGNFKLRVPEKGAGEVRHLAAAFNSMSEKLEALDETRNQFVANASHELKTPLAAMKVLIESLVYQPDMDKKLRIEFLQDVNKEIDRLSAIVSDLLTLVRMDAGSLQLHLEPLFVGDLVEENAHRLNTMARKRNQTLEIDVQDDCETSGDRGKLNQIIYNLMENAIKYTQDGGTIHVTLAREGANAVLTVEDNGPGIPKDALPHIFERFYRVDKARSRETGGTGLGLSIVKQLLTLHGGSIRAESEEGKGSTFIAEIPITQVQE
ncbi:MAG: HAMP domain-containing protein [Clostridia bacterium]|nr:HAMP domain-containing protein [Clostridia bacterium]